ncbi:hypothetical protein B0O99DRAFT_588937 [Bisporella sp. PMI_857]|nr:hypothetical protein B0O99DRAFT_588937 [Bisporella sp. PMI_857]
MSERFPPAQKEYLIKKFPLDPPSLSELVPIINAGLAQNFESAAVEVTACPDLRAAPFHLAGLGISGSERIVDIGGPPNLHPTPKFEKQYSLLSILKDIELDHGFLLGASAGPFHQLGYNSELMPNLAKGLDGQVYNRTHYAKVAEDGGYFSDFIQDNMRDCGLMANLFASEGSPGPVLKITARHRTGPLNFLASIQKSLANKYGERVVSLGGVFLITKGKVNMHVMPDFRREPLEDKDVPRWLKFFDMDAPLVCLSIFHSYDPGLDLRMEHTHCFSLQEKGRAAQGGHYHGDTTPDEVEYEAYFNTAKMLFRVDQPV